MKVLKIFLISIISLLVAVYLGFLFVLPYAIDLNKYSPQLTAEIEKASGFQVKTQGLKVRTAWNLSAGAFIEKVDLKYPKTFDNGEKFAQINGLEVKLSLLPLLFKQIKIDNINADKIIVVFSMDKNGKFLLEKCLPKSAAKTSESENLLTFSPSMPDISIKKYKITFVDSSTNKNYVVKGSNFKISDFTLNKKIKLKTAGSLILDNREQISYNLAIFSKIMPIIEEQKNTKKPQEINIIKVFKDLYKYNMRSNINTDLKITGTPEEMIIDGNLNVDKISFVLGGKTFPQSNLGLKFNGDKVKIKSDFYTDIDKKATITGVFNNGKKKSIDLRVLSQKTDIGNLFLIANTLSQIGGVNHFKGISADGILNADFKIKSDFKRIESNGFLKINNASITDNIYNATLKSIFADIDFSNNNIRIKKSSALLDGKPISVKGSINSDAIANILIIAENIDLKGLLFTAGQKQILKENDIFSGQISVNALIKGRLDKAIPTIDVIVDNVSLKNKPNKANVKLTNAHVKMVSNGKKTNGNILVSGLKIYPQGLKVVSVPKMELNFNEKDLKINNSALYFNNSKIDIFGEIKDYSGKKMKSDITAKGLIVASDIKSMLPKANQAGVSAVGELPLLVRITGDGKYNIDAQILANPTNHLAILDINTLRGKTSLINTQLTLDGNDLIIHESTLYSIGKNKGLSQNMKSNVSSGIKIMSESGKITNITSKVPNLRNVQVNIPNQLTTSIPGFPNSSIQVKGDLSLNGPSNNPEIKGYLTIPVVHIPTIKTNFKNLGLRFDKNNITANCPQMSIADSLMGFNAIVSNNFSHGIVIQNLDFNSNYINIDSLGAALSNLPAGSSNDVGVVVLNGKGIINKFKTGGLVASNISTKINLKNNWLILTNLLADAYFGKVAGSVKYNLIYGTINLDLRGRGLSAGPAIKGLTGVSQDIAGKLDFDSNVSMSGSTQAQILESLKGDTNFIITNGKMGNLGRLEHLLYAQNIIANNVFRASLNVIAKGLSVKNTGLYKYIKGSMTFSNGWANISSIKMSGPSMSLLMTGRYHLSNNVGNLVVLGRLSNDVVRIMGPIGDLSVDRVLSYIPRIGTITAALINQMTINPEEENISLIPDLTPKTQLPTKEFKVVINGDINRQSSVRYFKWLSAPKAANSTITPLNVGQTVQDARKQVQEAGRQIMQQIPTTIQPREYVKQYVPPVADFIKILPDLK